MRYKVRIIHGVLNYILAASLIITPWFFQAEDMELSRLILLLAGLGSLAIALISNYELGVLKTLKYKENLIANIILGMILLISPFLLGYHSIKHPQVFYGLVQILLPLIAYKIHFARKRSTLTPQFH